MRENRFQPIVIARLKETFPSCIVLKNDSSYLQGFPDLTVLYKKHWALLETKKGPKEHHQPNQDYYVNKAKRWSFGYFVDPTNLEEVLDELQQAWEA